MALSIYSVAVADNDVDADSEADDTLIVSFDRLVEAIDTIVVTALLLNVSGDSAISMTSIDRPATTSRSQSRSTSPSQSRMSLPTSSTSSLMCSKMAPPA